MDSGICRIEHADPSMFVLDRGFTAQPARQKYCGRCDVRADCLEYGKRTGSVGVWGGEVLAYGNRDETVLTPIILFDDIRNAAKIDNPDPLQEHQIFPFLKETG
jgi:hypothetical protein